MTRLVRLYAPIAALSLLMAACIPPNTTIVPTEEENLMEEIYVVANTTQLHYEDLSIGVGNFGREEYVDESGQTVRGTTAGLWIRVASDPEGTYHVRVHPGQEVLYDRYRIRVIEIVSQRDWAVSLGISVLEPVDG